MIGRILTLIFGSVVGVILIAIGVANSHDVRLVLVFDPINRQSPILSVDLPFFVYLFAILIIGIMVGGVVTWMTQSKWRRVARARTQEAMRWKGEAERLTRERDQNVAQHKAATGGAKPAHRPLAIAGR